VEYGRIAIGVTRTTPFYRSFIFYLKMKSADLLPAPCPNPALDLFPQERGEQSRALVKVGAKFAD
jgi:hypothetical protein